MTTVHEIDREINIRLPIDEIDDVVMMDVSNIKNTEVSVVDDSVSRLVSAPYDEQKVAEATFVSPCLSNESSPSITPISFMGSLNEIEHKYHIDARVLGQGKYGTVRRCIDRTTGQHYAVKSVRKSEPSVKPADLRREISLLQAMKHDSIIQLRDVYEDSKYVHLVTDLCTGGELFDKIVEKASSDSENQATNCFEEAEASRILFQILTAVSYMHKAGVVHRDIKPENILFETKDADSPVMIIDFGLARQHSSFEGPMKSVVGTPYYVAPEVLRKCYDKSCDLWSVGVIAYIMLCGYPPFNGLDNAETHKSILRGRYRFASEDWRGTSREARDFIQRMLKMDTRRRMTVEQALQHPFIVKHTALRIDESRDDDLSVEVVLDDKAMESIIFNQM